MSSAAAFAQPANDECVGAQVIPSAGPFPYLTPIVDVAAATSPASDPAMSCATTRNRTAWYRFTPSITGNYLIQRCSDSPTATNISLSNAVAVYTASGACTGFTQVASACASTTCPSATSGLTVPMTAGTDYYLMTAMSTATAPAAVVAAQLQLRIVLVSSPTNDVCASPTRLFLDRPVDEVLFTGANDYQLASSSACFAGTGQTTTTAPGRDLAYSFIAPSTGEYSFRVRALAGNLVTYTAATCTSGPAPATVSCTGAANRSSSSGGEEITCLPLTAGSQLVLHVDEVTAGTASVPFDVEVSSCTREVEPNGTPAQANALACPVTGSSVPLGDADFFALGSQPAGSRVFAIADGISGTSNDFDMRVTTAVDTLEYDDLNADSPWGSVAPVISGTTLPASASFIRMSHFSTTAPHEPYRLYAVVQPPSSAAITEAEPNDTAATATSGTANYFSGALSGTSPSPDVDFYSFEAVAGDLVFVGLDENPTRDATFMVGRITLLDAAGNVLTTANDTSTANTTTGGTGLSATSPSVPGDALLYRVRTTGTYFVRVTAGSAANGAGDYLLSISRNCVTGSPPTVLTATNVTPASGPTGGGTVVDIAGANFNAGATVTIGGVAATNVTVVNRYLLRATTPAGTAGPQALVVTNPDTTTTAPLTFTYVVVAPTAQSVAPNAGPTSGGTAITITGRDFVPGATVTVGGSVCASPTVTSPTTITCTTAGGPFGPAEVVVTNPGGLASPPLGNAFTYVDPAGITALFPTSGPAFGGTIITISGSNFAAGVTQVSFDTTPATNVTVTSTTSLTARSPAHPGGVVDVSVTNPGAPPAVLPASFEYIAPPAITSLNPTFGPSTGGNTVTITGTAFQSGATVRFGTTPATNVTVVSATSITATAPAGTGTVNVTVTNPDTQGSNASPYVFTPPPSVISVSPIGGALAGGTTVTISGINFQPGSTVTFGGAAATNVNVATATSITATTPAGAGTVPVVVNTPDGQTSNTTVTFRYGDAPAITALTPATGPFAGGQLVTITGANFFGPVTVTIGSVAATSVTVVNATTITLRTPMGMGSGLNVVVTNADTQTGTLPGAYSYIPAPVVTGIAPNNGPAAGGTVVTVTGTDFVMGASVFIAGSPATSVMFDSPTSLTATAPAGYLTGAAVTVVNPDGQLGTLLNAFTYRLPPDVTSVTPPSGPIAGGTMITLTGAAFVNGATVTVGGAAATNVVVVSPTTITATTPAGTAGPADLVVTNPDMQSVTLTGRFTYVASPTLAMLAPDSGALQGGTVVTLTGTNFRAGATVTFGGNAANSVTVVSPTSVTAVTPPGTGTVDVVLANADGQSATLMMAYTYVPAPTLSGLTPGAGPAAGGTPITISGGGFAAGTTATLGGTPLNNIMVVSPTQMTAVTAAHAPGRVDLVVTARDGRSAVLLGAYTYEAEVDAGSTGGGAGGSGGSGGAGGSGGSGGSGGTGGSGGSGGSTGGGSATGGGSSGTGGGSAGGTGGGGEMMASGCGCGYGGDLPMFVLALGALMARRRRR